MSTKTDITNSVAPGLRDEVQKRGAKIWRLERGTLMLRHPETCATRFYLNEEYAAGQLPHGKPPKRRSASGHTGADRIPAVDSPEDIMNVINLGRTVHA